MEVISREITEVGSLKIEQVVLPRRNSRVFTITLIENGVTKVFQFRDPIIHKKSNWFCDAQYPVGKMQSGR